MKDVKKFTDSSFGGNEEFRHWSGARILRTVLPT